MLFFSLKKKHVPSLCPHPETSVGCALQISTQTGSFAGIPLAAPCEATGGYTLGGFGTNERPELNDTMFTLLGHFLNS